MSGNNEDLIKAQNELIGVLFEIIKRLQSNNDLDTEYFDILGTQSCSDENNSRLSAITKERDQNAEVISRLLKQIESN